jgi:hypothetical protein
MPTLSYDLHVHQGPSRAPRWGDGRRVWEAARDAGARGFVWKAHERHTAELARKLPSEPVRAIASASLNAWASFDDVVEAVDAGARWVWGPTLGPDGEIGWDLPLPAWWDELAQWLAEPRQRLVLATGHLGADGREAMAALAERHDHLLCSVTHSLFVPLDELERLGELGCRLEVDAYTLTVDIAGRTRVQLEDAVARGPVYFTSDGGQQATGNPFVFGARTLDDVAAPELAEEIGVRNPEAVIAWLDS